MTKGSALRNRQRLVAVGSLLILLLAVLPNVLYLGHWPIPGMASDVHQFQSEAETREHAIHCHLGPSQCSDQPGSVGVWWLTHDQWSLSLDDEPQRVESHAYQTFPKPVVSRLTPPPRYA